MTKEKPLDDHQIAVLSVLFDDDVLGDVTLAAKKAEIPRNYGVSNLFTDRFCKEVQRLTDQFLAINAPTAAIALISVARDPTKPGAETVRKTAMDILSTQGMGKREKKEVEVTVQHNIVELPSKIALEHIPQDQIITLTPHEYVEEIEARNEALQSAQNEILSEAP